MIISFSSFPMILRLLLFATSLTWLPTCISGAIFPATKAVDPGFPFLEFSPSPSTKQSPSPFDCSEDGFLCDRIGVSGRWRLELGSYASSFRLTLAPPLRLREKILICLHKNDSLELCQCDQNDWISVQKGEWSSAMSPYDHFYLDVKVIGEVPGSISIFLGEELHWWRLYCLAIGFVFLLLAPVFSRWPLFYHASCMYIGVSLVLLNLLLQVMRSVPGVFTIIFLFVHGDMLRVGSMIIDDFPSLVHSFLLHRGVSDETLSILSIYTAAALVIIGAVGVVLPGARAGLVLREVAISKDGTIAIGVAKFGKWAIRIIAAILYSQSTLDIPLAVVAFLASCATCFLTSKWYHARKSKQFIEEAFYDAEDNIEWYNSVGDDPNGSYSRTSMSEEDRSPDCYPVK